jgi:CDP-diacylglycerol--glycerol-3-phosphate 3-phosphatidyltransferase
MRIYSIKPQFQKFLSPIKNIFVKLRVHPTTINILALLISLAGGLLIYYSSFNIWLLAYIPFIAFVRTALNALDGMVAREMKVGNQKFGEVLNEFIDRLSDSAFFIGIMFTNYVNLMLAGLTLIAVLLVSYIGIVGKAAGGSRQYAGLMGKADRMFWLSVACVAILIFGNLEIMNWFLWFALIFSIITVLMRFFAIKKELYIKTKK